MSNSSVSYGLCSNEDCDYAKQRKVIELAEGQDFLCPNCGKELVRTYPPSKSSFSPVLAIIGGVAVLFLIVVGFVFMKIVHRLVQPAPTAKLEHKTIAIHDTTPKDRPTPSHSEDTKPEDTKPEDIKTENTKDVKGIVVEPKDDSPQNGDTTDKKQSDKKQKDQTGNKSGSWDVPGELPPNNAQ